MKKILVTGATGFLGKYLAPLLKEKGFEVLALGRNAKTGAELQKKGITFCKGDFTNKAECAKYFEGVECVIHAGALSTVWGKWEDFYNANVKGTKNICELCIENGVKRLVYISSPSVYSAKKDRFDIHEHDVDKSNELNYYIKSKIMAEDIIKEYNKKGLYTVVIRPRGLFGIGDTSLIPRVLRANSKIGIPLLNGGKNFVDITHVKNVAYACYLGAVTQNINGEIFNITNGEPMEFRAILEQFLDSIGEKPKYLKLPFGLLYSVSVLSEWFYRTFKLKGEPMLTKYTVCTLAFSQTLNIEKAKKKLGYKPVISLAEGINEYGKWWKENHKN